MYCGALSAQVFAHKHPSLLELASQCALRPRIRLVALKSMSASDCNDEKAPLLGDGPVTVVAGDLQTWHDDIEVEPLRYCKY